MDHKKLNDKGFTLIEMVICFLLLGILLTAAAQVIASSTEVYYYTKSTSHGVQAAQIIATEIRGDLEEAVVKYLSDLDVDLPLGATSYCVYIPDTKDAIYFINNKGESVSYSIVPDLTSGNTSENKILQRKSVKIYNNSFDLLTSAEDSKTRLYDSKYVGMNYKVKSISFSVKYRSRYGHENPTAEDALPTGDCPVIELNLTVYSPQFGDYSCTEYIALYNFYGLNGAGIN